MVSALEKHIVKRKIERTIGKYLNTMATIAPVHTGKVGLKLFGRPAKRPIKPADQQFLDSSKSISFTYNKLSIRGYQWGNGAKKVLLLHGWQSHSARWYEIIRAFPLNGYTFYAIDAPGHGQSGGNFFSAPLYAGVIKQFCDQTGKMDAVIGHSMGAFSSLYAMSQLTLPKTERLVILATPGKAEDFITYFKKRLNLSEQTLHCIRNHFEAETGITFGDLTIARFAEQLDIPGLIIHDKTDRYTPFTYAEELAKKWTNSTLITTNGHGHSLLSAEVAQNVISFVTGKNNTVPEPSDNM